MNSKEQLILFVKNLIPGTVKTRLAEEIGIQGALDVYQFLVACTFDETKNLDCDKVVYYSEYVELGDIFEEENYTQKIQKGNELGERMADAIQTSFKEGYSKVVIIGSDCYDLKENILEDAFYALDENDLVIGPAKDGGFYLLGMKKMHASLFANKTYSHKKVLNELLTEVAKLGVSFELLPELSDIDTLQDLKDSDIDFEFVSEEE
jgi:uncharacterized protein